MRHWLLHSQFDWTAQSRHNMEVHVTGQQMTQEKKGGRLNHDQSSSWLKGMGGLQHLGTVWTTAVAAAAWACRAGPAGWMSKL